MLFREQITILDVENSKVTNRCEVRFFLIRGKVMYSGHYSPRPRGGGGKELLKKKKKKRKEFKGRSEGKEKRWEKKSEKGRKKGNTSIKKEGNYSYFVSLLNIGHYDRKNRKDFKKFQGGKIFLCGHNLYSWFVVNCKFFQFYLSIKTSLTTKCLLVLVGSKVSLIKNVFW